MKLFLISQDHNSEIVFLSYDSYDSAVVACDSALEAQEIHPDNHLKWDGTTWFIINNYGAKVVFDNDSSWCHPSHVKVRFIGTAEEGTKKGVILASYNAG